MIGRVRGGSGDEGKGGRAVSGQRSSSTERRRSARTYGRDPSLLDPLAPDWVVRILAPKKADVPWLDMVRSALTVPVILGVSVLVGQTGLGVFAGMGGLVGSFGDNGGSFRARFRRVLTGAALGSWASRWAGWSPARASGRC